MIKVFEEVTRIDEAVHLMESTSILERFSHMEKPTFTLQKDGGDSYM